MNDRKTLALFLENVLTVEDLHLLESEIATTLELVYATTSPVLGSKIDGHVSPNFHQIVLGLEANNTLPSENREQEAFFVGLKKFLEQISRVTLNLAFEPKREFVQRVAGWFLTNLSQKVILDIKVKREVIAGAIIEYNGKYRDYSKSRELVEVIGKYYENV